MATSYLIDTSVLIDVLNDKRRRAEALSDLVMLGATLASCPVTIAEIYAGMRPGEAPVTEALLSGLRFHEITLVVARLGGRLRYDWARRGRTLTLADALIAATALHYRLTLITDNVKRFPMPELEIADLS